MSPCELALGLTQEPGVNHSYYNFCILKNEDSAKIGFCLLAFTKELGDSNYLIQIYMHLVFLSPFWKIISLHFPFSLQAQLSFISDEPKLGKSPTERSLFKL